jgi:hypothetical protein
MFKQSGSGIPDLPTSLAVLVPGQVYPQCFQFVRVTQAGRLSLQLAGDSAPVSFGDVQAGEMIGPFAGSMIGADTTAVCVGIF